MDELKKLREIINEIDIELVRTIALRLRIAKKIQEWKINKDIAIEDKERENLVIKKAISTGRKNSVPENLIISIWKKLIESSKK